ncbi:MAG: RNA polymerase sigma factor [Candidatus Omnitrophota bacterium]
MQDIPRELIEKAAEGNMDAFEEIYRKASGYVYTIALRVTGNISDAEEVTQDVFLSVHRNLRKFRFAASFKTWIYRVTMNRAINLYRKRKKDEGPRVRFEDGNELDTLATVKEETFDKEDSRVRVNAMLEGLLEDQKVCLVLKDIEGLSYQEIADTLKIKINTVRTRIKRAREKLISRYGKGGGHEMR